MVHSNNKAPLRQSLPDRGGKEAKWSVRLVQSALFAFLRVLAWSVFMDQSFQLGAIERGKGAAGTGPVHGVLLGKAGERAIQITKPHFIPPRPQAGAYRF